MAFYEISEEIEEPRSSKEDGVLFCLSSHHVKVEKNKVHSTILSLQTLARGKKVSLKENITQKEKEILP